MWRRIYNFEGNDKKSFEAKHEKERKNENKKETNQGCNKEEDNNDEQKKYTNGMHE